MNFIDRFMHEIQENKNDDYLLPLFFVSVCDYVNKRPTLSYFGVSVILNANVVDEMKRLDLEPMHQQTLIRVYMYFSICLKLAQQFIEIAYDDEIWEKFPKNVVVFIKTQLPRTLVLITDYIEFLERWNRLILNPYCSELKDDVESCFNGV